MTADRAPRLGALARPALGEPEASAGEHAAEEAAWFQAELLEAAGQPIIAVDLHRVVTYWNRAAEEMFGWSGAEAIGRRSPELISRVETPEQTASITAALARGESWSGDYEVERRDGSRVCVCVTNKPVLDRDGHLVAVIGVCVDVTERKADEEARRHLAAIVDGTGDAIFAVTTDGIVTTWNGAAERLFGFAAEDIIGQPVALLAPPGSAEEQAQVRARLTAGGPHERLETVRTRKDGSLVDVLISASTTTDEEGTITGLSVIAHDITDRLAARQALEASEQRLAAAQRAARLGSFEHEVETGQMTWSAECFRILGLDPNLVPSLELFRSSVHPEDLDAATDATSDARQRREPYDIEFRIVRPDGTERCVRLRAAPEVAVDGTVLKVVGTIMDETERAEAERVRRTAEHRFEIGFEQSGIGAALVDLDGIPMRVNAALCALMGRPESELIGRRWTGFNHPDEVPLGQMVLARVAGGHDRYSDERRYIRPNGDVVWASTNVIVVRDETGEAQYLSAQLEDITARKLMEQELTHVALHDALTGLPNRALLIDRLAQRLAQPHRPGDSCAVLALNVDRLKPVNDTYGTAVGDDLLRAVAQRIVEAGRPGDTAARGNGDEFVVICHDVTLLEAERVAETILTAVKRPFLCGGQPLQVSASIGIAIADQHSTPEGLLRDADVAVWRAKERGRGRVELFDEVLRRQAQHRTTTALALQEGLERREFTVHYQPVVDLETGEMVSAEALVRWERPGHGLVGPNDFIPLAEETGLIIPIGAWVLEEACRQLVEWQRDQPSMTVAVNLSVRQIAAHDIVELIADTLLRTGARAEDVCLELTETVLMDDVDYFGTMLARLKALGVQLSIDDFGTGYSALSYLKRFPLDAVKVDRAFVSGLGTDPNDSALVVAVIALAEALGLKVTAEGVETQDQLVRLKQLRCPRAQGYFLARPMPPAAISQLLVDAHRWPVETPSGYPQSTPSGGSPVE